MDVKYRDINIVFESIDVQYHEAANKFGLSDAEFDILYSLVQSEDYIPQKRIYQETGKRRSTVNSAIKKLEREGNIELEAIDGRSTQVRLTEKGRKLAYDTVVKVIEIENKIYDGWSEKERDILLRLNREFLEQFTEEVGKM